MLLYMQQQSYHFTKKRTARKYSGTKNIVDLSNESGGVFYVPIFKCNNGKAKFRNF